MPMRPQRRAAARRKCALLDAGTGPALIQSAEDEPSPPPGKDLAMGYSIFYIIGVVVVVALILAWLF
ncbi:MAG TPA: hypothetical protein VKB80_20990 [Kofleriaceae bacterium]|nr:hypothetical protein [Kofleriaceae bacterium]